MRDDIKSKDNTHVLYERLLQTLSLYDNNV